MCAQSGACASLLTRGRERDTHKAKTRLGKAGLHTRRTGKLDLWQDRASLTSPILASPLACTGEVCPTPAASGRVLLHPDAPCLPLSPSPLTSIAR